MSFVLRDLFSKLGSKNYGIQVIFFDLCSMSYVLRFMFYELGGAFQIDIFFSKFRTLAELS